MTGVVLGPVLCDANCSGVLGDAKPPLSSISYQVAACPLSLRSIPSSGPPSAVHTRCAPCVRVATLEWGSQSARRNAQHMDVNHGTLWLCFQEARAYLLQPRLLSAVRESQGADGVATEDASQAGGCAAGRRARSSRPCRRQRQSGPSCSSVTMPGRKTRSGA